MTGRKADRDLVESGGAADDRDVSDTFDRLRGDIISGILLPGSRLRFADLQARYRIGTSPLREALSRLAADRLVVQEPNRGFKVPPLSLEDFSDIAALRIDLECQAIRRSVEVGDEAWEEGIVLTHHRLRRLGLEESGPRERQVPHTWEVRHRAFHTALIAACGSPWTLHFCNVLHDQFDRYRRWAGRDPEAQAVLSRHHQELVDAAVARTPDRATAILAAHIRLTTEAVSARLRAGHTPLAQVAGVNLR